MRGGKEEEEEERTEKRMRGKRSGSKTAEGGRGGWVWGDVICHRCARQRVGEAAARGSRSGCLLQSRQLKQGHAVVLSDTHTHTLPIQTYVPVCPLSSSEQPQRPRCQQRVRLRLDLGRVWAFCCSSNIPVNKQPLQLHCQRCFQ